MRNFLIKINHALCRIMLAVLRRVLPLNGNMILFESEGDFSDNSFALYDYMRRNGFFGKYRAGWFVSDPRRYRSVKDCVILSKRMRPYRFRTLCYMAVSKYFFYDHCNIFTPYGKREGQLILNLWHGTPFKGNAASDSKSSREDILSSISDFWSVYIAKFVGADISKTVVTGYPRNDYFFSPVPDSVKAFTRKVGWTRFSKIIFWMPTFRKSVNRGLSEDYYSGETGLPVIYSLGDMAALNDFLRRLNVLVVCKVHHLQADYPVFREKFSNIAILNDDQIHENGFQLYQFIPLSDCLITDYSSVSTDYLLLDRPIIYTMDDYGQYKASRGFMFENVEDYFAGHHVRNRQELFSAIGDIAAGKDPFSEDRRKILPVMHKYTDGMSCARVLECAGLRA